MPVEHLMQPSTETADIQVLIIFQNQYTVLLPVLEFYTDQMVDGGRGLFYGPNGSINVNIGPHDFDSNLGRVDVSGSDGLSKCGLYIDANNGKGVVYADVVQNITNNPKNLNESIHYSGIQGPEAAAYVRGTATLENGESFVAFPEHFTIVANTQSMTVQITPNHFDTYGIAVVKKTKEGFYVKELKGGTGHFSF